MSRTLGYVLLVLLTAVIAVRWAGLDRWPPLVQAMVLVPYLGAVALVAMIVLFATGRRRLGVWALVVTLAYFAALLPRWAVAPSETPKGYELRVMTANLYRGRADAKALVRRVAAVRPDLLAVQELTPGEARALERAGIARYLPTRKLMPAGKSAGSGLYSRGALHRGRDLSADSSYRMERASMSFGDAVLDIVSVHTRPPGLGDATADWFRDLRLLPGAGADGTQLLLGDFNATSDQHGLRRLTHHGYHDAATGVGSGLRPTWLDWPVPPATVDHVLVEPDLTPTDVTTYRLPGTDHRILTAHLVLPHGADH